MALYAVSDIHSYYDETMTALEEAGFLSSDKNRLVLVGDALDRGPKARETADFLLDLHRAGRLIFIHGNHEELLYRCLQDIASGMIGEIACGLSYHYRNRTWDTLLQLSGMSAREAVSFPSSLIERVKATDYYRELLPAAVDYYETDKYVFCHGWIPTRTTFDDGIEDHHYDANWRNADEEAWHRARWRNGMEMACMHGVREPGKTVVCGHWNASWGHAHISGTCSERGEDAISTPFYADGIIAIDACTALSGKVNCVVLEE